MPRHGGDPEEGLWKRERPRREESWLGKDSGRTCLFGSQGNAVSIPLSQSYQQVVLNAFNSILEKDFFKKIRFSF